MQTYQNCEPENPAESTRHEQCGQALSNAGREPTLTSRSLKPKNGRAVKYIVPAVLIIAVVIGIIYLYFYKVIPSQPAETAYKAQYAADIESYKAILFPPAIESFEDTFAEQYGSAQQYQATIQQQLQSFGANTETHVRVLDVEAAPDNVLTAFKATLTPQEADKVTGGAFVTVKIRISGDTTTQVTGAAVFTVKYDGKWYIGNSLI